MAVASRAGLTVEPVNLPAHLMLRPVVARPRARGGRSGERGERGGGGRGQADDPGSEGEEGGGGGRGEGERGGERGEGERDEGDEGGGGGLLIDAFHGGELLWLADAEARLSGITGMQARAPGLGAPAPRGPPGRVGPPPRRPRSRARPNRL
jgi:hypothetical protein